MEFLQNSLEERDRDSVQLNVNDVDEIFKMRLRVQNCRKMLNDPSLNETVLSYRVSLLVYEIIY